MVSAVDRYGRNFDFLDRTSLEYSHKALHQKTRTKHFTRTLAQSTSLEHSHKALHQNTRTKHFTRTLPQSTSLEHSHKALH
jgi:hypothetical protein